MAKYRLIIICAMLFSLHAATAQTQVAAGTVLANPPAAEDVGKWFFAEPVSDAVFARMRQGGSFPDGCTTRRGDLRYIRVLHYNYDGRVQVGEIVCNKLIANDLIEIFKALFQQKYEIQNVSLIDEYDADDEASMAANNSSCFCFRRVKGTSRPSKHAQGLAIDINPLDNPCVKYSSEGKILAIEPDTPAARRNASRTPKRKHTITRDDLACRLFVAHGFKWGGAWRTKKDFQHFEK